MYTFGVGFLGSTETPDATEAHLRNYAGKCKKAGWPARPVRVDFWTLDEAVQTQRASAPGITAVAVKTQLEADGYPFFATEAEAQAAGAAFVAHCETIITEVYGTSERDTRTMQEIRLAQKKGGR